MSISAQIDPGIPKTILDVIQLFFWLVSIIVGGVTGAKVLGELEEQNHNRKKEIKESQRELTWKKAAEAEKLLSEMYKNKLSAHAMLMLDWEDGRYYLPPEDWRGKVENTSKEFLIDRQAVIAALRPDESKGGRYFTDKEVYIRDCFDQFLYFIDRMQQAIEIDLVERKHIEFPTKYFIEKMKNDKHTYDQFIKDYGYTKSLVLMNDLGWQEGLTMNNQKQDITPIKN